MGLKNEILSSHFYTYFNGSIILWCAPFEDANLRCAWAFKVAVLSRKKQKLTSKSDLFHKQNNHFLKIRLWCNFYATVHKKMGQNQSYPPVL